MVAKSTSLKSIEVGLIGREGMTGFPVVMGETQSPQDTYVQVPGAGYWLDATALRVLLDARPAMQQLMLGYVHVLATQMAQTALANGRAKIDARLARWLLMTEDRLDGHEMPLTHNLVALMLGVRRPGVTDAIHRLEGQHLITAKRASISITDRVALEALADGSYGIPEAEYRRVLGAGDLAADLPRPLGEAA